MQHCRVPPAQYIPNNREKAPRCLGTAHARLFGAKQMSSKRKIQSNKPATARQSVKRGEPATRLVLDAKAPYSSAQSFLKRYYRSALALISLVHFQNDFYEWRSTHYAKIDDGELRKAIYEFLESAVERNGAGVSMPFKPTKPKVDNVVDALRAKVHQRDSLSVPTWFGNKEFPDPSDIISCRNGLLSLTTGKVFPHTPEFFNLNALAFDFDAGAPEPVRWLLFLRELFGEDKDSIECLQEIFGYLLTSATDQQKIFLIIGRPRSGKGTIARVLTALIGLANIAQPTLASLTAGFGLAPLIGKQLAVISDARISHRQDRQVVVERLLSISGEDHQTIDRKFKSAWIGRLAIRFLILSNELPALPDASAALASRMIILQLTQSFIGKEDIKLTDVLLRELPGILNWSLAGLRRLRARGHFTQPNSSREIVSELEDITSPIGSFVREFCEFGQDLSVQIQELYQAYGRWSKAQGVDPDAKPEFSRQLRAIVPGLRVRQERIDGGKRARLYVGIGLMPPPARDVTRVVQLIPKN
jgi:putative DNA primase/helicase